MFKCRVVESGSLGGMMWFGGWLFTTAFAELLWRQAIIGIVNWTG